MQPLSEILTYKTLHALCATTKGGKMTVVYYVSCLVYGPNPVWGVWNRNRKFLHFAGGREAIGKQHPRLAWRRIMTRWHLTSEEDSVASVRRQLLAAEFKAPLPTPVEKPARPEVEIAPGVVVFH